MFPGFIKRTPNHSEDYFFFQLLGQISPIKNLTNDEIMNDDDNDDVTSSRTTMTTINEGEGKGDKEGSPSRRHVTLTDELQDLLRDMVSSN